MSSSELIRWGGLAAMGAGVLFLLYSPLSLATGKGGEASPLDILAILAYVLQVVGLVGFHALQQRNYGRIGRAGLYTSIGAIVVWEFLILASLFGGGEGLPGGLVSVGVLGMLVGLVLYGAATLQAKVLPRWCGILFIILVPSTILFSTFIADYYSNIWEGVVWIALGYGLWSHRGAAAEQPARVR